MKRRRLGTTASWLLLGWGTALLISPRAAAEAVLGGTPVPPTPVLRVLGARQVAQQLALVSWPGSRVATTAASVEALHALSMGVAALVWPHYRRAALTSAAVATTAGLLDIRFARADRAAEALWGAG